MKFDIPAGAERILQTLTRAGYEACLVGGCVRDLLRGVRPRDWDICTSARPEETAACFPGRRVIETGLKHGTVTVMEAGEPYEITTYRADGPYSDSRRPDFVRFVSDLETDLARRDFSMNAIALGLEGGLRDPFGGEADIRAGRIRCVGEPSRRFQEDGLRLMRALRFSSVLGWEIEDRTARAAHENRTVLTHVSAERVNAELRLLLVGERAGDVLRKYPDVLCRFWPELEALAAPGRNGWERAVRAVEAAPAELVPRLAALLAGADAEETDRMLLALRFGKKTRKRVAALKQSGPSLGEGPLRVKM